MERKRAFVGLCAGLFLALTSGTFVLLSIYSPGMDIPSNMFWNIAYFIQGVIVVVIAVSILKSG
jgi:hypothetical protein